MDEDQLKLEHLRECFSNMHSTIRFLDGKTAALISLVLFALGGMAFLVKYVLRLEGVETGEYELSCLDKFALFCALLSGVAASASILFCIVTNAPRKKLTSGKTLLFPICTCNCQGTDSFANDLSQVLHGMSYQGILKEYIDQLANLGVIVGNKMKWLRRGVWAFGLQFVFAVIAMLLFLLNCLVS